MNQETNNGDKNLKIREYVEINQHPLNNHCIQSKSEGKLKNCIETDRNRDVIYQSQRDVAKDVLRGEFIATNIKN